LVCCLLFFMLATRWQQETCQFVVYVDFCPSLRWFGPSNFASHWIWDGGKTALSELLEKWQL
jgi:hypothetical protein